MGVDAGWAAVQLDRARGVLLGCAAGDALGAPYEFEPPRGPELPVTMTGGGMLGWAPGEWTDDTAMTVAVAELAAGGADLRDDATQDALVARWTEWSLGAPDVGNQTRAVLADAGRTAHGARKAAADLHRRTGHTAGNGSLMRTAPVALAFLRDEDAMAAAARSVSELTHYDPDAGDACVLWCLAIGHAVRGGELDVRRGLPRLAADRRPTWTERIDAAEASRPADFPNNGWVVHALQSAWSAIATTAVPAEAPEHLRLALDAAVRSGNDTDTVAAIAGALLGARWGASAVPGAWVRLLNGWPGIAAPELAGLATRIVGAG